MTETPREIEIKIDLQNESNYRTLIAFLKPVRTPVMQENHFFDTTDWSLFRAGWVIRLRLEDARALLTAKGRSQAAPEGLAVRTDIEIPVSNESAQISLKDALATGDLPPAIKNSVLFSDPEKKLERRFFFRNYRLRLEPRESFPGMRLEIDRTEFFDNTKDWELEVELASTGDFPHALEILKGLFREIGVPLNFQKKSKFIRALARLKNGPEGNI